MFFCWLVDAGVAVDIGGGLFLVFISRQILVDGKHVSIEDVLQCQLFIFDF